MLRKLRRCGWGFGVVLGILLISGVSTTTVFGTYFTGMVSNDWSDAGNWAGGITPSTDITNGTMISGADGWSILRSPVLNSADTTTKLNVGTWATASLSIIPDANLTVTGALTLGNTGSGTINQTGGNVVVGDQFALANSTGGAGSAYNISGGSLTVTGNSSRLIGARAPVSMNVSGTAVVTFGSPSDMAPLEIGSGYDGTTGTSTFTQSGGIVNLQNTLSGVRLGFQATATGVYDLTGGILNLDTNIVNTDGAGYLKLNGGTLNFTGASIDVDHLEVGTAANGSWAMTSGQSLTAGDLVLGSGATSGIFDVLGGTAGAGDLLFSGATSKLRLGDGQSFYVLQSNYSVADGLADVGAGFVAAYTSGSSVQVGTFVYEDVTYTQLLGVAIPEPSTIVLLAVGLLGLLAYAWRKRK